MTEGEVLELQRRNLTAALVRCGWKIYGRSGAAELLGLKPTTLIERMRRMGIRRPA
jgi:transcriptional regulator with GAF, ATPase, and Fis domain